MAPARSGPVATVVLDSEAVAALADVRHRKHRAVLAYLEGVAQRRSKIPTRVVVPVAVRVEAGWDRTSPRAALVNRLSCAQDVPLAGDAANRAEQLRAATGVSVVDATVGQAAETATKPVVILSSDVDDMGKLAAAVDGEVRVERV